MSDLKDRLRADLTTAMKARDEVRSSTLRMVSSDSTASTSASNRKIEISPSNWKSSVEFMSLRCFICVPLCDKPNPR